MKLSDQVCTLEQGRKLMELGVAQDSLYYYYGGFLEQDHGIQPAKYFEGTTSKNAAYSLFTVAELGEMLPTGYDTMRVSLPDGWRGYDDQSRDCPEDKIYQTEAQARAAMLIHLLETSLITPEEVNKRINSPLK